MRAPSPSVFPAIAADTQAVDRLIYDSLHTGVPLVAEVSQYLIQAGGKRLRPALLLLVAGALGYTGVHHHRLAAVVEFIHTATLLHDDVVDESILRRGLPTANAQFGNPASVLVGDFLYSRAFQMMVEVQDLRVMQILADATNTIAEGEVLQLMHLGDINVDEAGYLRVINAKTAKLFEASARLGAVLAGSTAEREQQCAAYGRAVGTAFQIIDDVLDYDGTVDALGKNLGGDLREGKPTLPLILALRMGTPAQTAVLRDAVAQSQAEQAATVSPDLLQQVLQIVRDSGALQAAREQARKQAELAVSTLTHMPDNIYTQTLRELAVSLQDRTA
ncbi:MAG: polyprenyl synthetase family protein [Brachymonas sp.]|nr:polyprenyl synthetase family protein [Brachymonas sp.]